MPGIAVDGAALALPGIPGGAGMGLKALRGADAATDALRGLDRLHTAHQVLNVAQTVDQAVGVGQGLYQAHQAFAAGQGGWGAFYLGLTSFSGLNLANKGARSLGYRWEFDSSRLGTAGGRVRLKRVEIAVGTRTLGVKWTSKDPLVGELANRIENLYSGHVRSVNVPLYNDAGRLVTDADILLKNAVLQVKSGAGRGMPGQLLRTEGVTDLPVIGYGPFLKHGTVKAAERAGRLITTDERLLLEVVKP